MSVSVIFALSVYSVEVRCTAYRTCETYVPYTAHGHREFFSKQGFVAGLVIMPQAQSRAVRSAKAKTICT